MKCHQCKKNPLPSPMHKYCPECLVLRQRAARKVYEQHHKGKPQVKANVVAMKEQKEFEEKQRAQAKYQPKHITPIMTEEEQHKINIACAKKTLNVDLRDPALRHRTQACSWLWRAA